MNLQPWRAGILAAVLLAGPALAQERGLSVRSGVSAYTGDLGGGTDVGGFLGIQAEGRLFPAVGLELGYEGSANGFEENDSGTLWRHNVGALAKLGPIVDDRWQPFVGAGLGVSYLDPTGEAGANIFDDDVVAEVPLAAGIEYRFSGVTAGARATYRIVAGEDFAPGNVDEGDLFTAGLSLGGRF
ncbi:porin family protein [Pyxidicoccus xibeiensis]|uniref:outer membrane beta-barrel protein n=1 Tax=Pyxidicoccus xibeiensis TaxID=2906759 RepID=UPI0020A75F5A|nr:outer membrane beta-barrel protein [Pyxidicoccus xibeiensis]MCP3138483.1 porin family protein [Pyxidicoccus xibeiensis]